jgi:hypothetical protein
VFFSSSVKPIERIFSNCSGYLVEGCIIPDVDALGVLVSFEEDALKFGAFLIIN